MNTIIRQVLAFSLSLFIVIFPTIQQANAASSWSVTKAVSSGSRTIVNATNSGYKAAINIAPNIPKVAKTLGKAANRAYLIYAVAKLFDGVDWVMNPDNNSIKIKDGVDDTINANPYSLWTATGIPNFYTADEAAVAACARYGYTYVSTNTSSRIAVCKNSSGSTQNIAIKTVNNPDYDSNLGFVPAPKYKNIPLSDVAANVISNAIGGDKKAQEITKAAAVEAVIAGDYDADLLAGAVPTTETKPVIPAVPGAQTGDVNVGLTGGDVGAAADAARADADAARAAADAARDAYDNAAKEAAKAAADAKDLINEAIDQAIKDAAAAAAADAAQAAADAKAVADAAQAAALEAAKTAADKAVAAAEKAAADARADADATAESIAAAEKAVADAKAAAKEATEAAKEAAKAAEKPFELPAFCSWATPVCDAVDWLMKPAPDLGDDTALDIDDSDVLPVDTDINFGGSCPANFEFNGSMFGNPINIVLLDTSKFCGFLSTFVKFPVYAASSLFALYILGGRKDV